MMRTTVSRVISSGSFTSSWPPPLPTLLRIRPWLRSWSMISSRNFSGMCSASAMAPAPTGPSPRRRARCRRALIAYFARLVSMGPIGLTTRGDAWAKPYLPGRKASISPAAPGLNNRPLLHRDTMPFDFPATRWSLIARLPDQPQQAAALVGLYADAVGEYLRRRLIGERRERVDDVIQDVLLDLMRKPELLARAAPGSGSRFRYYLMNLAWLAALNALRHERRRTHASIDAAGADD